MHHSPYQLDDLLNDDSFVRWVLQPDENSSWAHFLEQNPSQRPQVEKARQLVLDIHAAEQQAHELPLDSGAIWNRIGAQTIEQVPTELTRRFWQVPAYQWAAALLILTLVGTLVFVAPRSGTLTYHDLVARATTQRIEKINTTGAPLSLSLEDGSTVLLQAGAKLNYPARFDPHHREVVLSGEAFFEISRDASRPFYVYSNELVTKVLGTSFQISARDHDKQVVVKVRTGRVSVFKQNQVGLPDPESGGLVLLPNQQAVFSRESTLLNRCLVEEPLPIPSLASRTQKYFEEVPVSNVLQELERLYGVPILYNEDVLAGCVITTTLSSESLYDQLEVITHTIGATYKEIDAQILIESNGCRP